MAEDGKTHGAADLVWLSVFLAQLEKPWVSKSMLNTYARCPRLYKFRYVEKRKAPESWEAKLGSVFHAWAKEFWAKIPNDPTWNDFKALIPKRAAGDLVEMMEWFAQLEWERLNELRDEGFPELWRPVLLEYPFTVDMGNYIATAIVDRVDMNPDGSYTIVEYKTGLYHRMSELRRELAFYSRVLERSGYRPVTLFVVINPAKREVIVEEPKRATFRAMDRLIGRFLMDQEYRPKVSDFCSRCSFYLECRGETDGSDPG